MDALRLVSKELFRFVFFEWFGWRYISSTNNYLELPPYEWQKPAPVVPRSLVKIEDTPPLSLSKDRTAAYVNKQKANVLTVPALTLDGVLLEIPFGSVVEILETQNRWFKIIYKGVNGWMLRDDLVEELKEPQFKLGNFYPSDAEETIVIRSTLDDEFAGALASLPLAGEEYVSYRLKRQGVKIAWGKERPRLSGTWQNLLKGRPGSHIGITPKKGAVMEIVLDSTMGHLAYIEAVYPDQSILISEVGWPEIGQYSERTLPKAEWIEWRPVFIEIT